MRLLQVLLLMASWLLVCCAHNLLAQTYNMSNNTVTSCAGTLYDSGGELGSYNNDEVFSFTICPTSFDECIALNFENLNTEIGSDFLFIYDGEDATGEPLTSSFSGTLTPGATFRSTAGCLTLVFESNEDATLGGFEITWVCEACGFLGDCPDGGTSPSNDACINALNLGTLPSPAECIGITGGDASPIIQTNLSNQCATAELPYAFITDCLDSGADMSSLAADVWYRFVLTGPQLEVQMTNGFPNANIGLWYDNGGGCGNLVALGCLVGDGNDLSGTFEPLNTNETYYLQVSGSNLNEQGTFDLTLKNTLDCNACIQEQSFTVSPPAINGEYLPGEEVTFCYTVSEYNQINTNWIHGVVPEFGSGWDLSTLTNIPATSCTIGSNEGVWSWYDTQITGSQNGSIVGPVGPGFFYESPAGPSALDPNNPGDNYGDPDVGQGVCSLEFCWTISVLQEIQTVEQEDLSITVETYSDSESGGYLPLSCQFDPNYQFFATANTCATCTTSYIELKVYLEAAYDLPTGEMSTHLRDNNLLPNQQPFNTAPWFYEGTEGVNAIPRKVVDWVLVELRNANDYNIIESVKPAFLLNDGNIIDVDNLNYVLSFDNIIVNEEYYILVRSRNHLATMSATPILFTGTSIASYDFTTAVSQAFGPNQQAQLAPEIAAQFTGDFDSNGVITLADFNKYTNEFGGINQYTNSDGNMDGSTTIQDFNAYFPNANLQGVNVIRY